MKNNVRLIREADIPFNDAIKSIGVDTHTPVPELKALETSIKNFVADFTKDSNDESQLTIRVVTIELVEVSLSISTNGIEKRFFTKFFRKGDVWERAHTWFDPRMHDIDSE